MRISDWSSDVCSSDLGKESSHGAALGEAEVALAREKLGWPHAPFEIPDAIAKGWDAKAKGAVAEQDWQVRFKDYAAKFPADAAEFQRRMRGDRKSTRLNSSH